MLINEGSNAEEEEEEEKEEEEEEVEGEGARRAISAYPTLTCLNRFLAHRGKLCAATVGRSLT
jgi:hypothetical protein